MSAYAISRRGLLGGGASLIGGLAAPGLLSAPALAAPAPPKLNGGRIRPTPDFSLAPRYVACARPHRDTGVRIEQKTLPTSSGNKVLIHNYGHSGAGITLSFGCASVVADMVAKVLVQMQSTTRPMVAVLGCGVIGLTVATELRRRWPKLFVIVYSPHKETDLGGITSFKAGGQFEPTGAFREYLDPHGDPLPEMATFHNYVRRSYQRFFEIQNSGKRQLYGVARRANYTLREGSPGFDLGTPRDVVPAPQEGALPFTRLNERGKEYSTFLINPTIFLPRLVLDLKAAGVGFRQKTFAANEDWGAMQENILINCTGLGAAKLFGGDNKMIPTRGQLVILPNNNPAGLNYFFSGGCGNGVAYMFARQNDIVVGGTWEDHTVETDPGACDAVNHDMCDTFLRRVRRVFDGDTASCHLTS